MLSPGFQTLGTEKVRPEWIDHNGHMNVAYYVLAFDEALTGFIYDIGIDKSYRQTQKKSVFVLEAHVTYLQEVHEGAPLDISIRLLDFDEKRLHLFLQMHHGDKKFLAATSEQMVLSIDMNGPKATPLPAEAIAKLQKLHADQKSFDWPAQAKANIGIRRRREPA